MNLTVLERELIIEALTTRASRLESYGRFHPRTAGPHDRKAAAMRALAHKLIERTNEPGVGRHAAQARA